jgi:hypothetical protein
LASVAPAHADPSFVLTDTQARAGDPVHFSITGAQKLTYELEVGDIEVLEGSAVSGQFTMPNLGETARSVTVEAELRVPDRSKTTVRRQLQYLGPVVEAEPVALPVPKQAASAPEPIHTPSAAVVPASPAPAKPATGRSTKTRPRQERKRHAVKRQRHTARNRGTTHRKEHGRNKTSETRAKGPVPRTAPLFDGVPEAGPPRHPRGNDAPGLKAIAPPTAALTTTAGRGDSGESSLAILVPGLLGLAAFSLAGITLLRRQRNR